MKFKFLFSFTLLLMSLVSAEVSAITSDFPLEKLSSKPVPEFELPEVDKFTLSNGITVSYVQDKELPIFQMRTYFTWGQISEKKEERYLMSLFMQLLRDGGSEKKTPDEVERFLEERAAHFQAGAGFELSYFGMDSLLSEMEDVLPVYFENLLAPRFDEGRRQLLLKKAADAIKKRNEVPLHAAIREFNQAVYGQNSPYAWLYNEESLSQITSEKMKSFYANYVGPQNMKIAAISPLTANEFKGMLEKHLAGWSPEVKNMTVPSEIKKKLSVQKIYIDHPGNQAAVIMGHMGLKRFNPDRFALFVWDDILGGSGTTSRLGKRLRSELGLTYGAQSAVMTSRDFGRFLMVTTTKTESVTQVLKEMRTILEEMFRRDALTEAEVEKAKKTLLGKLVFEYEQKDAMLYDLVENEVLGYPPNNLEIYKQGIESVTKESLEKAVQKYIHPDKLTVIVVGNREGLKSQEILNSFTEIPLDFE
jgi:zinc protease